MWKPISPFVLSTVGQKPPRCGTPVPLYYCAMWGNDHPGVEPLSYFSTSHCGTYHPGVEPLFYFSTSHCGQCSARCGTPVLVFYFPLWALITKVCNPCPTYLHHTEGTDHQGVEPLSYFSTSHCGVTITEVWNHFAPLLL